MELLLKSPVFDFLWMTLSIPFLIYLLPPLLKFLVPYLGIGAARRRRLTELERTIVDYNSELGKINEVREFALYSKTKRKVNQAIKDFDTYRAQNPNYEIRLVFVLMLVGKLASAYIFCMLVKRLILVLLDYTNLV